MIDKRGHVYSMRYDMRYPFAEWFIKTLKEQEINYNLDSNNVSISNSIKLDSLKRLIELI